MQNNLKTLGRTWQGGLGRDAAFVSVTDDEYVESIEVYEDSTRMVDRRDAGSLDLTPERIERLRDMMICKLHHYRVSLRSISKIMNIPPPSLRRRLRAIPEDVRRYYGSGSLELG